MPIQTTTIDLPSAARQTAATKALIEQAPGLLARLNQEPTLMTVLTLIGTVAHRVDTLETLLRLVVDVETAAFVPPPAAPH